MNTEKTKKISMALVVFLLCICCLCIGALGEYVITANEVEYNGTSGTKSVAQAINELYARSNSTGGFDVDIIAQGLSGDNPSTTYTITASDVSTYKEMIGIGCGGNNWNPDWATHPDVNSTATCNLLIDHAIAGSGPISKVTAARISNYSAGSTISLNGYFGGFYVILGIK